MDGNSSDIIAEQKDKLRQLFPEVFSEGKIDWEKLKAVLGEDVELGERYNFTWKGKSDVYGEIQRATTATLKSAREESVSYDDTDNLFIEGDNLEALKILQKSYFGKVKMIYIDPPYNTGNDFVYNDTFAQTRRDYAEESGDIDTEGNATRADGLSKNSKDSGHFHSNWLNMMYPRLYLARNLLKNDGVIFVSIDDNEVHNLRMIMNQIFGEENFVAQLVWERAYAPKNDAKFVSNSHDYVLVYSKSIDEFKIGRLSRTEVADSRYSNPDKDPRGVWKASDMSVKTYSAANDYQITTPSGRVVEPPASRCWSLSKNIFFERLKDNRIWFGPNGDSVPSIKRFLSELKFEGMAPTSLLFYKEVGHSQEGAKEVVSLFDGNGYFDGPKPIRLIKRLITMSGLKDDDIVLDFFSGSGTTAHAVEALNTEDGSNRKWIMVQLPEVTDEKSEAFKAGYRNIADIAKERIRRAGKKITEDFSTRHPELDSGSSNKKLDTGFKVLRLDETNFKIWDTSVRDEEGLRQQMLQHLNPIKPGAAEEDLLTELLLKSGISFDTPVKSVNLDGAKYYVVQSEEPLIICLAEEMTEPLFQKLLFETPAKIIFLDSALKNNDQLKTNLLLQSEKAGVEVLVV